MSVLAASILAAALVPPPVVQPPEREYPPVVVRPATIVPASADKTPSAKPGEKAAAPAFGTVPLVTVLTPADAARLFRERGGSVDSYQDTPEGFLIHATVPNQTFVTLQALDCRGQGEDKKCAIYVFEAAFKMENDQRAAQLERDLALNYVADRATGSVYSVWRMGTLNDGVTEAQLRGDLERFMQTVWATSAKAWPNTQPTSNGGSAPPTAVKPEVRPTSSPTPRANTRHQFVRAASDR